MALHDHPEWLIQSLGDLPAQTDPSFEQEVHRLFEQASPRAWAATPKGKLEAAQREFLRHEVFLHSHIHPPVLKAIADDQELCEELRFNAFFAQQTRLWRERDYRRFRDNVRNYRQALTDQPMFVHQQAMSLLSRFDLLSLRSALRLARDALDSLPSSPGVLNLLSEITAEISERYRDKISELEIDQAIISIDTAIKINRHYAKYYVNRARLLALQHRYDEAIGDVRTAIEVEPISDNPASTLRLAGYELILNRIDIQQREHKWEAEQKRVHDEHRRNRLETMVMLGLLAAVVGFVVTGFDIATDYDPLAATAIIGVLAGTIMIVFASFGILVSVRPRFTSRTIVVVVIVLIPLLLIGCSGWILWILHEV